ncbi:soluble lytic murein transglycosylase-like protein [Polaromonas sp. CG_9.5]|uniref:lytic transglycosylase domain-containing protein n=1 Tax=Polaromonas sp. CG_9.5 TaxID=3071705 RepID=UPI002E020077|nr:soluble lytic murein transglycosylase-like protein [Polaromonas sp. CG_9.5]
MTALVNDHPDFNIKAPLKNVRSGLATVADDIGQGFFLVTHNSLALVGMAVVFAVITLLARPDLRDAGELKLMAWLQERRVAVVQPQAPKLPKEAERTATASVTATAKPKILSSQQAAIASWISKKYSVAQEPVGALVAEAFEIGHNVKLDPTLILAIMAIESGFNPFAQSPVGAQGLMQVMTQIHHDKYANLGGKRAAFDPVANLRVGVKVLQECISRAGSIEGGLKYYVGAANLPSDGGYASKVMAERDRLLAVVAGKRPPTSRFYASPAPSRPIPVSLPANTSTQKSNENDAEKVALLGQS